VRIQLRNKGASPYRRPNGEVVLGGETFAVEQKEFDAMIHRQQIGIRFEVLEESFAPTVATAEEELDGADAGDGPDEVPAAVETEEAAAASAPEPPTPRRSTAKKAGVKRRAAGKRSHGR